MEYVWIGIGSNLSDPKAQVDCAIVSLSKLPTTKLVSCSSYYCSVPLGMKNQPHFLNAVVILNTNLEPEELLVWIRKIEQQQGRVRNFCNRWISRTLDLDILLFGNFIINTSQLIIPHYDILNREFVIYPMFELDKFLVFPNGMNIKAIMVNVPKIGLSLWKS